MSSPADLKPQMRVALVAHVFGSQDGQGRVNYEIARAALHAGMYVTLIAERCAADLYSHNHTRTVILPTSKFPTRFLKNISFAFRSAWWLRRNRSQLDVIQANGFTTFVAVDIVAAHFVHGAWLQSPYAVAKGRRRNPYALYQRIYTRANAYLEQTAFRRARRMVAVSGNVADELRRAGAQACKLITIFNGVDLHEFYPRVVHPSLFQLPADVPLFLFAGDLRTSRKNLDTVLHAVQQLRGLHLAVAGAVEGGPFPALAKQLGIADRVHFLGHVSDMSPLMAAVHAFIFPSRYDPLGLVVLEAMASGLPVVTSSSTGASAVLADPQWTLKDPEDLGELIRMMHELMADPSLRQKVGAANREKALEFSWHAMAASYLDLHRAVFAEKTRETARHDLTAGRA